MSLQFAVFEDYLKIYLLCQIFISPPLDKDITPQDYDFLIYIVVPSEIFLLNWCLRYSFLQLKLQEKTDKVIKAKSSQLQGIVSVIS